MKNFTLKDVHGNIYSFGSEKSVFEFLNIEERFWKSRLDSLIKEFHRQPGRMSNNSNFDRATISKMVNALSYASLQYAAENYERSSDAPDDEINVDLSDIWISHKSAFTTKWNEARLISEKCAQAFFESVINSHSPHSEDFNFMRGYLLAYEFLMPEADTITSRADLEMARLSDLYNNADDLDRQYREKLDTLTEDSIKVHNDHEELLAKTILNTEETFKAKLRLDGPVEYWEKKAKTNFRQGIVSGSILGLFLLSVSATLFYSFNTWLSGAPIKLDLNSVTGAFIFAAFLSSLVFITRALSKYTFSAFHLQRDAEERQQLTHVYLALIKETEMDKEAQNIVIQSLFSRTETGLLNNESGPTMPGLTELIGAVRKP